MATLLPTSLETYDMKCCDEFRNHNSLNRPLKVAIYTRFSTDKQYQQSIINRINPCTNFAKSEAWEIVEFYHDEEISCSVLQLRPGIQHLLRDALMGSFDIVLTESIEMLGRNQEHSAHIFNTLKNNRIGIQTLSEGVISERHVGIVDTMNAMAKTLARKKTFSGQVGRVKKGRWAGGPPPYGYKLKPHAATKDINGDDKGRLAIVTAASNIVQRIYREYADGHSPISIATRLNADGIPSPLGKQWCDSTIRGDDKYCTGILNNECYNGLYIWNKHTYDSNIYDNKRSRRINPRGLWQMSAVPRWKFIDDDLYRAVRMRQAQVRLESTATINNTQESLNQIQPNSASLPQKMLTGLMRCGCCDALYKGRSKKLLSCSSHERKGSCRNSRTVSRPMIERHVYNAFKDLLNDKNAIDAMFDAFDKEFQNLVQTERSEHQHTKQSLEQITHEITAMVNAIKSGLCSETLSAELIKHERDKKELERQLNAKSNISKHNRDRVRTLYQYAIADMYSFLEAGSELHAAQQLIRPMINKITVVPGLKRGEIEILFTGSISALPAFNDWQALGG